MKVIKEFLIGKSIVPAVYSTLNRGDLIYLKDGSMRVMVYRAPIYYTQKIKVKSVEDFFKTSAASTILDFTAIDYFVHNPNLYKLFGLEMGQILKVGDKKITSNGVTLHPHFKTHLNNIMGIYMGKLLLKIDRGIQVYLNAFEVYPPILEDNYNLF